MKLLYMFSMTVFAVCISVSAHAAILVVSTKGEAAFMTGGQWKPLAKGQTIAEGTKISTGVNSTAILNIDGSVVTVKPLTSIKIYKNSVNPQTRETSIGLQFGAIQAKIDKVAKVKTRFNITTPVATSSVRGTEEVVGHGAGDGTTVKVIEGNVEVTDNDGNSNTISGSMQYSKSNDSKSGSLNDNLDIEGDLNTDELTDEMDRDNKPKATVTITLDWSGFY
jgi:hypothetical protein